MSLNTEFLQNKRLLGIDFGEKVIGTALYHWGRDPFPMPYEKIINLDTDHILQEFTNILSNECIEIIIIGVPYLLDGTSTSMTKKAQDFRTWMQEKFPHIKCIEQDETLSTFEAKDRMKNSPRYNFKIDPKKIDTLSAAIILEQFIEQVAHEN